MVVLNRKDWYNTDYIVYNIISQLKYRYLSIIKQSKKDPKKKILSRYYMGYSLDLFRDSLKRNGAFDDTSSKIYFDLATYKDENGFTPIFSFDKQQRKEQKKLFSGDPNKNNGQYLKLIKSYDFAIDIDCKNLKTAWKDTKRIKGIFDEYKLPYSLRFSGSKGFHFVIDSRFIDLKIKTIDLPDLFGTIVQNLAKDEWGVDKKGNPKGNIDFSIYDARRILKLAYSLCNNDGVEYVCLPLSDENFNN